MVRSTAMSLVVGLAVFGLAACGGDDNGGPTDPDDDVSEEQAAEVAAAVSVGMSHAFGLALAGGTNSLAPGALTPGSVDGLPVAADEVSWNIDNSGSCPEGGSTSIMGSGTITDTQGSGSTTLDFDWNSDVEYNDCAVSTENGIFTLSTSSPVSYTGNGTVTSTQDGGGTGNFTWNMDGSLNWSEGGESGSCSVDMTTSLDFSSGGSGGGTWTGSISGSVCGHSVDQSWDTTITV